MTHPASVPREPDAITPESTAIVDEAIKQAMEWFQEMEG